MNNERHFLVVASKVDVIIREVPAGSCAVTWTRSDAWAWAKKLAAPRKVSRTRIPGKQIIFIDPAGQSRLVA